MMSTDALNAVLDELDTDDQRFGSSIILGYLWAEANAETRDAAVAAMRRHVK